LNNKWNSIYVEARTEAKLMKVKTLEKFIYEHYYGTPKLMNIAVKNTNYIQVGWLMKY
jgi:hypothetical protein